MVPVNQRPQVVSGPRWSDHQRIRWLPVPGGQLTKVFRASRKSEDSDNLTSKVIRGNIRFYYCKVNVSLYITEKNEL